MVLLAVGAAEQLTLGRNVQGHVALHLDGADDEHSGGHQHGSALILMAGVDGSLHRLRVERRAIAFRAEVDDVVDPGAGGVTGRGRGCGGQQTRTEGGRGHQPQPVASGSGIVGVNHGSPDI